MENASIPGAAAVQAADRCTGSFVFARTINCAIVSEWVYYKSKAFHVSEFAEIERKGRYLSLRLRSNEILKTSCWMDEDAKRFADTFNLSLDSHRHRTAMARPYEKPTVLFHNSTYLITDSVFAKEDFAFDLRELAGYETEKPRLFFTATSLSISFASFLILMFANLRWCLLAFGIIAFIFLTLACYMFFTAREWILKLKINPGKTLFVAVPVCMYKKVVVALDKAIAANASETNDTLADRSTPKVIYVFDDAMFGSLRLSTAAFQRWGWKFLIDDISGVGLRRTHVCQFISVVQALIAAPVVLIPMSFFTSREFVDTFAMTFGGSLLAVSIVFAIYRYIVTKVDDIELKLKSGKTIRLSPIFGAALGTKAARDEYDRKIGLVFQALKALVATRACQEGDVGV